MPDWKKEIWARMERLNLSPETKEEVIAELAAHFEEIHDSALSSGKNDTEASQLALQEVSDWNALSAEIRRAKADGGTMNHRTKSLWIPFLAALLGASVLLMAIQFSGFNPRLTWVHGTGMLFYWPWLAGLPVFGAFGAYLSRRADGSVRSRVIAGLSPALVMLIVMSIVLPFGLLIDGWHFFIVVAFGLGFLNWVVFPAVALFLGTLPFLGTSPVDGKMIDECPQ